MSELTRRKVEERIEDIVKGEVKIILNRMEGQIDTTGDYHRVRELCNSIEKDSEAYNRIKLIYGLINISRDLYRDGFQRQADDAFQIYKDMRLKYKI